MPCRCILLRRPLTCLGAGSGAPAKVGLVEIIAKGIHQGIQCERYRNQFPLLVHRRVLRRRGVVRERTRDCCLGSRWLFCRYGPGMARGGFGTAALLSAPLVVYAVLTII